MNATSGHKIVLRFVVTVLVATAPLAHAANQWINGVGNLDWFDGANWSEGVPVAGQEVVLATGNILLTNATPELASFTMSGGTLTFKGWETALKAVEMSIGATVTHAANTTNENGGDRLTGTFFYLTDTISLSLLLSRYYPAVSPLILARNGLRPHSLKTGVAFARLFNNNHKATYGWR